LRKRIVNMSSLRTDPRLFSEKIAEENEKQTNKINLYFVCIKLHENIFLKLKLKLKLNYAFFLTTFSAYRSWFLFLFRKHFFSRRTTTIFFFFYSSAASALPKNGNILFPLSGVLVQCPLLSFTQTNTCLFTASL